MTTSNVTPCNLIEDGYTERHTIPADPPWHSSLTITFRPMVAVERSSLVFGVNRHVEAGDVKKAERFADEKLAERLIEWDLKDRNGNPALVNADSIGRLEPHLSAKVFNVVRGELRYEQEVEDDAKN